MRNRWWRPQTLLLLTGRGRQAAHGICDAEEDCYRGQQCPVVHPAWAQTPAWPESCLPGQMQFCLRFHMLRKVHHQVRLLFS